MEGGREGGREGWVKEVSEEIILRPQVQHMQGYYSDLAQQ